MERRGRANSNFQRNTQRRLSMRRRQGWVRNTDDSAQTRVRVLADRITKVKLKNLDGVAELQSHITGPKDQVSNTTRMFLGSNKFIQFADQDGRKIYADLDYTQDNNLGELVDAAMKRSADGLEANANPVQRIIVKSPPENLKAAVMAEIWKTVGNQIPITFADAVQQQDNAPAVPPNRSLTDLSSKFKKFRQGDRPPAPNIKTLLNYKEFESALKQRDLYLGDSGKALVQRLKEFNKSITKRHQELFGDTDIRDASPQQVSALMDEHNRKIRDAKTALQTALRIYKETSRSNKVLKTDREAQRQLEDPNYRDPKLQAVRDLEAALTQFEAARDIREAENALRVEKFNPVLNSDIDTRQKGLVLGEGVNGQVMAFTYNTNGRKGLPRRFVAARKPNSAHPTGPAAGAGVPRNNPEQAQRAEATFHVSKAVNMDNVPPTSVLLEPDANGDLQVSQLIEVVNGTDGQIEMEISLEERIRLKTNEAIEARKRDGQPFNRDNILKTITEQAQMELEFNTEVLNNKLRLGEVDDDFKAQLRDSKMRIKTLPDGTSTVVFFQPMVVNLPYQTDGTIQKGLADLQILDMIIGHPDRHGGNYKFELSTDRPLRIIGVKALDNDDALGNLWSEGALTPGLPPLVDFHTALGVLEANLENFRPALNLLSPADGQALVERFGDIRGELVGKLLNQETARSAEITTEQIKRLAKLLDLSVGEVRTLVGDPPLWGSPAVFEANVVRNNDGTISSDSTSTGYLGQIAYRSQDHVEGTTKAVFNKLP